MPLKEFTKEQVSQHNKDGDAWMIINDKVYDVSEFLDAHPGGKRVMMPLLGKDASAQFKLYHTAATVLDGKYNKSLMIGKLQGTEDVEQFDAAADTFGSMVAFADPAWYQGWATPYYNDSHKKFRAWMRSFIQKEMMPFVHQWEQAGQVPKSLYKKCGENGLLAAISGIYPFPAQYAPVKTPPGGVSIKEW